MKWQSKGRPTEVRPFLVLPLLEGERSVSADGTTIPPGARNTSSGTSTGTWPPKLKLKLKKNKKKTNNNDGDDDDEKEMKRPLTATLERPELLNIHLLDSLDMSLVRKEFLCITNLCKETVNISDVVVSSRNRSTPRMGLGLGGILKGNRSQPAILNNNTTTATNSKNNEMMIKRSRKPETSEDSLESDENTSVRRSRRKISKINKLIKPVKVVKVVQAVQVLKKQNDANNNNNNNNNESTLLSAKKPATNRLFARSKYTPLTSPKVADDTLSSASSSSSPPNQNLPEPCTTCGRPDQPERFHSHPATPLIRRDSPRKTPPTNKSSVQKPVAIKYKPQQQSREKSPQKSAAAVVTTPKDKDTKTVAMNPPKSVKVEDKVRPPRTVTCYLCGREFGTKSLPLHEPKCLEKWERENSQLPRHLQRKPPTKPDKPLTPEEWNKFAWEASQSALARCENCGRTFLPDRLIVHQRSCKPKPNQRPPPNISRPSPSDLHLSSISPTSSGMRSIPTSPPSGPNGPPTIPCYICGRNFGSRSIKIHEPQCLRKWQAQNDLLPVDKRKPVPVKNGKIETIEQPSTKAVEATPTPNTNPNINTNTNRPPSGPRKPMLPCYICGREYGTSSIYIHEPQCLKKWRQENEKLPISQRRKEPERPDIKFTPSGQIDYEATNDSLWQSHLSQLVPCQMCGRTFNPDRVVVHERSCKGTQ